jgi:hypothetical protein
MTAQLPRATPSELNVDAGRVIDFLDAVAGSGTELHSLMIIRHGAVAAEGWWAPDRRDDIQLLYSPSKTFTSMAVGIAMPRLVRRLSLERMPSVFFGAMGRSRARQRSRARRGRWRSVKAVRICW